jgi:hypothetical protein
MKPLFWKAGEIHTIMPWEFLSEDNLIAFDDPVSGERCYCSVMGELGEAFVVQAYLGDASLHQFEKAHEGEGAYLDFFANQRSALVRFDKISELEAPDRELARAMGHPLAKGTEAPAFRAIRPGYQPWYPTESEARTLSHALDVVRLLCAFNEEHPDVDHWEHPGFPLVEIRTPEGTDDIELTVTHCDPREFEPPAPYIPQLDSERLQAIQKRHLRKSGFLEIDHFYLPAGIGEEHSRKYYTRIFLSIHSELGMIPPQIIPPEGAFGDMLMEQVLKGIESGGRIPAEIHVRSMEFKLQLDGMANALGITLRVKESLPELDFASREMLAFLSRDRG